MFDPNADLTVEFVRIWDILKDQILKFIDELSILGRADAGSTVSVFKSISKSYKNLHSMLSLMRESEIRNDMLEALESQIDKKRKIIEKLNGVIIQSSGGSSFHEIMSDINIDVRQDIINKAKIQESTEAKELVPSI
eukprot:GHVO01049353.1.p1 GENE.GHVO01049353.1~~GHVO01049353.1.p1  ORF type:complete len:137 (+),score=18.27 GHVO01049353.1:180-590(+)